MAAAERKSSEVRLRGDLRFVDPRLGALLAAVNAERAPGFPIGRLFLDCIEQALAVALVNNYAVRCPSRRIYRGGLTPARLRKVVELVHAEIESDLTLEELAERPGVVPLDGSSTSNRSRNAAER